MLRKVSIRGVCLRAGVTLALTTFAFVGCGKTELSSGDDAMEEPAIVPEVSSVEELCAEYPTAWSAYMARCYGGEPEAWRDTFDAPCGPAIRSVAEGRSVLGVGEAAACLTRLQGDDCSFNALRDIGSPCVGLLVGSVPTGEPCTPLGPWGDECGPDAYCRRHGPGCEASCEGFGGVLGASCAGSYNTTVCGRGLVCDPSLGCQVAAVEGEECVESLNCAAGLYCDAAGGTPATCRRVKTEGPCQSTVQCAPAGGDRGRFVARRTRVTSWYARHSG